MLMENGFCEVNSIRERKIWGHHQIPKITFEVSVDTLARHQMLECGGLGSSDFFWPWYTCSVNLDFEMSRLGPGILLLLQTNEMTQCQLLTLHTKKKYIEIHIIWFALEFVHRCSCTFVCSTDMSNSTFFTPIPKPNISKDALTIPNTNTNFLMSP